MCLVKCGEEKVATSNIKVYKIVGKKLPFKRRFKCWIMPFDVGVNNKEAAFTSYVCGSEDDVNSIMFVEGYCSFTTLEALISYLKLNCTSPAKYIVSAYIPSGSKYYADNSVIISSNIVIEKPIMKILSNV